MLEPDVGGYCFILSSSDRIRGRLYSLAGRFSGQAIRVASPYDGEGKIKTKRDVMEKMSRRWSRLIKPF